MRDPNRHGRVAGVSSEVSINGEGHWAHHILLNARTNSKQGREVGQDGKEVCFATSDQIVFRWTLNVSFDMFPNKWVSI